MSIIKIHTMLLYATYNNATRSPSMANTKGDFILLLVVIVILIIAIILITIEVFTTHDPKAKKLLIVSIALLAVELCVNLVLMTVMFVNKDNYGYYTPLVMSLLSTIIGGTALGILLTAWHTCDGGSGLWFSGLFALGVSFAGMLAFTFNHFTANDEIYIDQFPNKYGNVPSSSPNTATTSTTNAAKQPKPQQYTNLTGK